MAAIRSASQASVRLKERLKEMEAAHMAMEEPCL